MPKPSIHRHDPAELERARERNDAAAKAGMQKSAKRVEGVVSKDTSGPLVTLRELAVELGMDRSACRRYVLRLGYKPVKQRTAESGFQTALTFTRVQADEIRTKRSAEGYC